MGGKVRYCASLGTPLVRNPIQDVGVTASVDVQPLIGIFANPAINHLIALLVFLLPKWVHPEVGRLALHVPFYPES